MEQGLLKEILDVVVDIKTEQKEMKNNQEKMQETLNNVVEEQKEMKETLNNVETEQIVIKEKIHGIETEQKLMSFKLNTLMDEQRDTKDIAGAIVRELGNLSKRITAVTNGEIY